MHAPQVTVVVVPRERFSCTRQTLESIRAHTDIPYELVWVDGGSPARIRRYLKAQARAQGFRLVRTNYFLSPNQARNLGLREVGTKYVVFIDNDVVVGPGWLGALVECAEQTGAAVVGPLNCEGLPVHETVHFAGGECHIVVECRDGRAERHLIDRIHRAGERVADVRDQLKREQTEVAEFHCLMIRTEVFDEVGPFDERLLTVRENLDLCMLVAETGGTVYLEPASIVTYLGGIPLALMDLPFYLFRWNDAWTLASLRHLRDKWRLTEDEYFLRQYRNMGWRRRDYLIQNTLLRRLPSWRTRLKLEQLLYPVATLLSRRVLVRNERARARHARAAAWGPAPDRH